MNFIEQIVQSILRPMRQQYRLNRLGPTQFHVASLQTGRQMLIERSDDTLLNRHGRRLHVSLFEIQQPQTHPRPYVIYLHANNGCRLEGILTKHAGISYLKPLLQNELNVVVFDCTGSGVSDGQYVSLGVRESEDLEHIVEYLLNRRNVKDVCLWGRSMGAVTALLFSSRSKHRQLIRCCIYDSPFRSLKRLIKELASQKTGLPQFVFAPLLPMIDSKIQEKCGWGLKQLKLKEHVTKITCPGLFITSKNDKMVRCEHAEKLFNSYPAYKQIEYIKEQHHQGRPDTLVAKCVAFLRRGLDISNESSQGSKRKLHNIFTSGSLLSCQSAKSSGRKLELSSDDGTSIVSLYSHIPSSVSNRPGKVSITSLKKLLDGEQPKQPDAISEETKSNILEGYRHNQTTLRKVLQPQSPVANLQHRPNIQNKLVVQQHCRRIQHDSVNKGITLTSKRGET